MPLVLDGTTGFSGGGGVATSTALGSSALFTNSTGTNLVAIGYQAGYFTTAGPNVFVGSQAGYTNSTGTSNIGIGYQALYSNTTASENTAVGYQALYSNTTGYAGVSIGRQAGYSTTTGIGNTYMGYLAGYTNTTNGNNTYIGNQAGYSATGATNTYLGKGAGYSMTSGSSNVIVGGHSGNQGGLDIRTSSNNVVLSDGDGNIRQYFDSSGNAYFNHGSASTVSPAPSGISMASAVNVPLQIYMLKQTQVEAHIGFKSSSDTNLYMGTSGGGGSGGIGVYGLYQQNVTNSWTSVSDERLKTELQPIENALDKVANVRTVTGRFTYDEENGVTRRLPFLIAQDFLTALPEAVDQQNPDKLGLSYSDTIVLAFAAIKELKTLVDAQSALITGQAAEIVALKAKVGL